MVDTHRNRKVRVGRTQLIREVCRELHMSEDHVAPVIQKFIRDVSNHLAQGESVSLSHDGLGRFDVVKGAPRVGRNVRMGEALVIPARLRVKFVPSLELKHIAGKKE